MADSSDPRVLIGHVHLKVADLDRAVAFYAGVLGFQVTSRDGDSAAFLSAGGYHHHLGANIWQSRGALFAPEGYARLTQMTVVLPRASGLAARRVTDPSGIPVAFDLGDT